MMKFLSNLLNATGVIVGDMIEGWASQVPRAHLIDELRAQTDRVNDLEAELDRLYEENLTLRKELQSADDVTVTSGQDYFDRWEQDYGEVPPPVETEHVKRVKVQCPECHNFSCCCIPF